MKLVNSDESARDQARAAEELSRLAKRRKIDLSDAPELAPAAWEKPIRGMEAWLRTVRAGGLYKPVKRAVSMRLDADVVEWLKNAGPGYQTRANQILREKMMEEMAS
jgi:uncharacterized protein (DUF4415 family)